MSNSEPTNGAADKQPDPADHTPATTPPAQPTDPAPAPTGAPDKPPKPPKSSFVSPRQLEANKRNSLLSTGPTSAEGKATVSRNAIKHGIYADVRPIEQGPFREDPLAVQALVNGVLDALKPRDAMERAAAIRVANLMVQIGRYHTMDTFQLERMTRSHEFIALAGPGLFEALYNVEFYSHVAETLARDPGTYTQADWEDLLLAAAALDDGVRKIYNMFGYDEPGDLDSAHDMILSTLTVRLGGGDRVKAAGKLAEFADMENAKLPDQTKEETAAATGIKLAHKNHTFETNSRILARLSAALDRELKRYQHLRLIADQAKWDQAEEDEPEMYDDYDYDNPGGVTEPYFDNGAGQDSADPERRRPTIWDITHGTPEW